MFGYITLGGQKFEAFLWEDEEPVWYDCVILNSREALEQEIVALHFRVPVDRVFLDEAVEEDLSPESNAIAEKCRTKLQKGEKIGKKLSFDLPALNDILVEETKEVERLPLTFSAEPSQLSEADMEFEVELMLSRMESGTPRVGGNLDFPEGSDIIDGAMLYQAETFGGTFVDENVDSNIGGGIITKASTIKRHMIETFLDSPQCSLDPLPRIPTIPGLFRGMSGTPRNTTAPGIGCLAPMGNDLNRWSMDFTSIASEALPDDEESVTRPRPVARVSTAPCLPDPEADLPPLEEEPALLGRQPAFVSTRGKEREIWQTYREEITNTWRAELEEIRKGLFTEAANMGA